MKEFHARRTSNGINSATLRQFPMEGGEPATGAMVTGRPCIPTRFLDDASRPGGRRPSHAIARFGAFVIRAGCIAPTTNVADFHSNTGAQCAV